MFGYGVPRASHGESGDKIVRRKFKRRARRQGRERIAEQIEAALIEEDEALSDYDDYDDYDYGYPDYDNMENYCRCGEQISVFRERCSMCEVGENDIRRFATKRKNRELMIRTLIQYPDFNELIKCSVKY